MITVLNSNQLFFKVFIKTDVFSDKGNHLNVFFSEFGVKVHHVTWNSEKGLLCFCLHDHYLVLLEIKVYVEGKVVRK